MFLTTIFLFLIFSPILSNGDASEVIHFVAQSNPKTDSSKGFSSTLTEAWGAASKSPIPRSLQLSRRRKVEMYPGVTEDHKPKPNENFSRIFLISATIIILLLVICFIVTLLYYLCKRCSTILIPLQNVEMVEFSQRYFWQGTRVGSI